MTNAEAGFKQAGKAFPDTKTAATKALYRHRGKKHAPPPDKRSPLYHVPKPGRRVCLMCEKIFDSKDVGNRRCSRCVRNLDQRIDGF